MYSNIYLVTVYHRRKHLLIQRLTRGTMHDADVLVDAIYDACFNGILRNLTATVAEITDSNVTLYGEPGEKVVEVKRNIDKDIYICHIFKSKTFDCVCTVYKEYADIIMAGIHPDDDVPIIHYAVNKVNFRGVHKLDGNDETRIHFTSYPNCYREDFLEETINVKI